MTGRRFTAVVLDLFDTLVRWSPSGLPSYSYKGEELRSTLPLLLPLLEEALGDRFDSMAWVEAYFAVLTEIAHERSAAGTEVTCRERFRRALERSSVPAGTDLDDLAGQLTRVHMGRVRSVTSAPPENVDAVRSLARDYRLGLLSNFDDGDTGRAVVEDTGIGELFEAVVISADVGLRKPNPEIFRLMLRRLALEPSRVLFVGDQVRDDVGGARSVGMPVAWVSNGKEPFPADEDPPDFVVKTLADLPELLRATG